MLTREPTMSDARAARWMEPCLKDEEFTFSLHTVTLPQVALQTPRI